MKKNNYIISVLAVVTLLCVIGPQIVQACTYHAYTQCYADRLYWYDSCGNIEDVAQYCSNGCYGNTCQNTSYNQNPYYYNNPNYYPGYNQNYGNCASRAYRLCQGDNIYWYDSCGNQQELYQSCSSVNMTCQYGNCIQRQVTPPAQPAYVKHYKTACYQNNVYWYDSNNSVNDVYKNCSDNNSCTKDSCSGRTCSNVLVCDGSTCATASADYTKYCATNTGSTQNPNVGTSTPPATSNPPVASPSTNTPSTNTPSGGSAGSDSNSNQPQQPGLTVSLFVKGDANSTQWQKTIQVTPNSRIYFSMSIANNSAFSVNNITVSANIPSEVSSLGNLQLNGVQIAGDIVAGVPVGSLAPNATQTLTFEGKTQGFTTQGDRQASVSTNASGNTSADTLTLTFNPSQEQPAAVTSAPKANGFVEFLKRWYLWILVALVLVFLFIVVFRRLSKNA